LQERKIAHCARHRRDAVVTANPGCIIQIVQGLRAKGCPVQVSTSSSSSTRPTGQVGVARVKVLALS